MDVVLYYKASNPDAVDLPKEEKEKMEKETGQEPKEEAWDELVSEPPAPIEMEPTEAGEEGKEEGKQDEDSNPCPEASEENALRISESRKVTAAKGRIVWEMGPWAQMPRCSG